MKLYSPLRYPGGKRRLAKFVGLICEKNKINGHYIEPYAGGAAVALYLLLEGYVSEIIINDIDRSIYAFWYSVLNRTDQLCNLIEKTEINIPNWKNCRRLQRRKQRVSLLNLGFSTFFLNRTNMSGIIDAGVIGGVHQEGKYKMDCRYNKKDLMQRIRHIAKYKKKISIYNLDALDLIKKVQLKAQNTSSFYYFDPPYYLKGESLYINHYNHEDHEKVKDTIKKIKNARWIVSYDDVPEINKMYEGCKNIEYFISHSAQHAKQGKEILFFSNNLKIPKIISPLDYIFK